MSDSIYGAVFRRAKVAMLMIDPANGAIIDANDAALTFYGYDRQRLLGMSIGAINILTAQEIAEEMARAEAEQRNHFFFLHRLANGHVRHVEVHSGPLSVSGRLVLYSIIHDITERRQAEAERDQLVQAIEQSPSALLLTSPGGQVDYVNDAFARSLGQARQTFPGQQIASLMPGLGDQPEFSRIWQQLIGGQPWMGVVSRPQQDQLVVWERIRMFPLRDLQGQISQCAVVKENITEQKQSEDLIRRLNRRFRDVVDAATEVAIIATDPAGTISIFNCGAERMLGWTADEMIDRQTPLVFHDAAEVQSRLSELSANLGHPLTPFDVFTLIPRMAGQEKRHWRYVRKDGTRLLVSLVVTPVKGDAGQIIGFVGIAVDISQQSHAEQRMRDSEARYHEIFSDSPQPMWVYDTEQRRFLDVNRAAIAQYGYSAEEFASLSLPDIVVGSDSLASGQQQHRTRSGEVIDVQVWTRRLPGSDASVKIALLVNVTANNRAQAAILAANQRLDQQAVQLKQVNEELEQFAYVASHDLRQPLRMVTSYLTLLERQLGSSLTEDQTSFLNFARDGAKRMDRLILDLLDYSRVGRVSSPHQMVSLSEVLRDCQANLYVALRESGGVLELPDHLPSVSGHHSELTRLFQNLIGNALKYHAPNVIPKIRLTCVDLGSHWQISTQDNGIGIALADQQRIFAVFQRLVSADQYEGTGIGLAVCKKIVTHHGGQIWVESETGQGSTFHVTLAK